MERETVNDTTPQEDRNGEPLDALCPVRIRFSRVRIPEQLRQDLLEAGLHPRGRFEWLGRLRPELVDKLDHDVEHAQGVLETRGEEGDPAPPEDDLHKPARGPAMSHSALRRWREDAAVRVMLAPPADQEGDSLQKATDVYQKAFSAEGLPHLLGHPDMPVAARMLLDAVGREEPLGSWELMRACGLGRPPPGSLY